MKQLFRCDCSVCCSAGFRLIASFATINKVHLTKIDVEAVVLWADDAESDVYVVHLHESQDLMKYFSLFATAAYGLVDSNAKW